MWPTSNDLVFQWGIYIKWILDRFVVLGLGELSIINDLNFFH